MSELLIPNSTQVPNLLLDQIMPIVSPAEWKVITFICRKTFGWQKREDRISLTQFVSGARLSRRHVVTILAKLTTSTLLRRTEGPKGDVYALNLDCDLKAVTGALSSPVHSVHQCTQFTKSGELSSPELVNSVHPQNKLIKPKKHTGAKNRPPKTPLPEGFAISDRVRSWAIEKDYTHLEKRLEYFIGYVRANGKCYADWDQALMNSIRDDWAKLNPKPESNRSNGNGNGKVKFGPIDTSPSQPNQQTLDYLDRAKAAAAGAAK